MLKPPSNAAQHPIQVSDECFFRANPERRFHVRRYVAGEFGFDKAVTLFGKAPSGQTAEIDTVVVRRFPAFFKWLALPIGRIALPDTDTAIIAFLHGYGVDPDTLSNRVGSR